MALEELESGELLVADTENHCIRLVRYDPNIDAEVERRLPWLCGHCQSERSADVDKCESCARKRDRDTRVVMSSNLRPSIKGRVQVTTVVGRPTDNRVVDTPKTVV